METLESVAMRTFWYNKQTLKLQMRDLLLIVKLGAACWAAQNVNFLSNFL